MKQLFLRGGVIVLAAFSIFSPSGTAQESSAPSAEPSNVPTTAPTFRVDPRDFGIGEFVRWPEHPSFAVTKKSRRPIVVVTDFSGTERAHPAEKIAQLKKDVAALEADFLQLSAAGDAVAVPAFLAAVGATDAALGDAFVFDAKKTLVYRGAIDDAPFSGSAEKHFLLDALRAATSAQPAAVPATAYSGRPHQPRTDVVAAKDLTWHRDIARLFEARCNTCHHDGGNAPFAFGGYADIKKRVKMIDQVVESGQMPPWFADKKVSHAFQNDRSLSVREKKALLEWIEAGAPEGSPEDAPLARTWLKEWSIGKPDKVYAIPEPYKIPASGVIQYKYCWVKTDLPEDMWIQKMEVRCSQPQVVHHVLVFLEDPPKDTGKRRFGPEFQAGLTGYFAGLVPGEQTSIYLPGRAKKLPAGASLKFQIHYSPNGKAVEDLVEIGFVFAKAPPEIEIKTSAATNTMLRIPPGKPDYVSKATYRFSKPGTIYSFAPHMHVRGAAFKYEIIFPDGKTIVPLDIPKWDFNWQYRYELTDPIEVPRGTKVISTAVFDNSEKNPANPDAKKTVHFGEQTFDEMHIGYFEWTAHE